MKISFIIPKNNFLADLVPHLEDLGHEIVWNDIDESCDVIICWSLSQMELTKKLRAKAPGVPLINYNWDVYEWTRTDARGYDWDAYGRFLKESIDIWTPSIPVGMRMSEYYDIQKYHIIQTFARFFEPPVEVEDKRFVINVMRAQKDRNYGMFEKACTELGIPYYSPNHEWSETEFQEKLSTCTFLVCPYYEASTGGLTLLEGHRLGKPVLMSNSRYMGGREYFGSRARYFQHDNIESLKNELLKLWHGTPKLNIRDCYNFTEKFTSKKMAKNIHLRLKEIL